MNEANAKPLDYYFLPLMDFNRPAISLADRNGLAFDAYRFESFSPLFDMARRQAILEAA